MVGRCVLELYSLSIASAQEFWPEPLEFLVGLEVRDGSARLAVDDSGKSGEAQLVVLFALDGVGLANVRRSPPPAEGEALYGARADGRDRRDEVPAGFANREERHGVPARVDVVGGVHPNHVAAELGVPRLREVQNVRDASLFLLAFAAAGPVCVRHCVVAWRWEGREQE